VTSSPVLLAPDPGADAPPDPLAALQHELHTTLNGVIGISRLLEDTALDRQQREYVQALRVSGEGLLSAVEGILDLSALEAGTLELVEEPFDLRTLVEEVCSVVALRASDAEMDVLSHVDPAVPAIVHGDERRLRQALNYLVGTAVERPPAATVSVSVRPGAGGGARIEVTRAQAGTLAVPPIAGRLAALMGGSCGVGLDGDDQSSLWLSLPLHAAAVDAPRAPQTELADARVVVVGADAAGREHLARQLQEWSAHVTVADDRDQALRTLRTAARAEQPFALALIEHLPDTAELVGTIRGDRALQGTRTVVLAAQRAVPAVAALDADGLLTKPVGQTRLYAELTRVLAEGEPAADDEPPQVAGSCGRVLIAEDNAVNQLVAVRLLEQRGFVVDVAVDGREALALHAHHVYDAIFMDCQMPEISGYEATREIRRREGEKRHTPIIAMTASTLPDDRRRCIEAGMDDYIGKPVRPGGLDHIIARAVTRR